jgi:hypothetical protein
VLAKIQPLVGFHSDGRLERIARDKTPAYYKRYYFIARKGF